MRGLHQGLDELPLRGQGGGGDYVLTATYGVYIAYNIIRRYRSFLSLLVPFFVSVFLAESITILGILFGSVI